MKILAAAVMALAAGAMAMAANALALARVPAAVPADVVPERAQPVVFAAVARERR
jgi:hypothetical protein